MRVFPFVSVSLRQCESLAPRFWFPWLPAFSRREEWRRRGFFRSQCGLSRSNRGLPCTWTSFCTVEGVKKRRKFTEKSTLILEKRLIHKNHSSTKKSITRNHHTKSSTRCNHRHIIPTVPTLYLDRKQIFDAPGLEFGHDGFGDVEVGELASFFMRIDDRRRRRIVFGEVFFVRQRRRRRRRRG